MSVNALAPILVIIITYNSAEHIANCLDSLELLSTPRRIVVFDNGSQDDTAAIAERHRSQAEVVRSEENLGFGRAINKVAAAEAFEYLLLINPDAVLHRGTLEALLEAAGEFPDAGIYGGRTIDLQARSKPGSVLGQPNLAHAARFAACFGFIPFTGRWEPDALAGGEPRGVRQVPAIEGSLLLISAQAWQQLGGFDEAFFLYGEDVDLCVRAYKLGFRVIYSERATYTHIRGGSSSNKAESMKLMLRGRRMLYERYASGQWGVLLLSIGVFLRATFEPFFRSTNVWRYCWRERSFWLDRL